ncbi:MAG: RNA polymerase sigma factor, partial [Solirubrobacteraceae bacterium]
MEASAFERAMPARAARRRLPRRSDARLVAHLRAGDERAFEELYDRYGASLLAFCRHMLGSPEEGEDALQHTFMAAHGALERGEAPEHLKAWLYTIARNRCLSVLRAQREHAAFEDDAPAAVSTAGLAAEVQQRTELRELVADLGRLPEDQRAALVLFELGDHAQDEIAAVLGVRREKVKALVFQAREALIGWRTARETPCAEVREQLSTLRGSALRRAPLRRHVEVCAGCRDFEAQVRRQRAALAVALPIVPAAGLKSAVLSAALGGGAASAAATATTAATAGSGALAAVQGVAAKGLVAVAIAAGAGGTGYVAVKQIDRAPAAPAHHAPAATRRPAAAATGAAAPARHAPAATP